MPIKATPFDFVILGIIFLILGFMLTLLLSIRKEVKKLNENTTAEDLDIQQLAQTVNTAVTNINALIASLKGATLTDAQQANLDNLKQSVAALAAIGQ